MRINMGELKRDVSIIGVGCTPFGSVLTTPALKDMTERELFAWAAIEAMEDAGVEAKDIDAFFVGHTMSESFGKMCATFGSVSDWIGMRWKPGFSHETACSSSTSGLKHAVLTVASGLSDIVLSGGVQITTSRPIIGKPPHMREAIPYGEMSVFASMSTLDQAYWYPGGTSAAAIVEVACMTYAKKYNVPMEKIMDALNIASINNRENAVKNPLAAMAMTTLQDEAKEKGFDDVLEYMRSENNPQVGLYLRLLNCSLVNDGASALIVCPTEMAKRFTDHPINVIGIGSACAQIYHETDPVWQLEAEAFDQAYKMANINPEKEVDYMSIHDCFTVQHMTSTEMGGYFKPGEAWRAILDGRTKIDGDKPLMTSGGRTSMGHAFAASGGAEVTEAVRQMLGKCGDRQVNPIPEVSVIDNMGGGMHCNVVVLRNGS